jgi:hypothetical protein
VFSSSTYIIYTHTHTHTYTALLHIPSLCLFHYQTTALFSSFTTHLLGFPFLNHFFFIECWPSIVDQEVLPIRELIRSNSISTTRSSVSHKQKLSCFTCMRSLTSLIAIINIDFCSTTYSFCMRLQVLR